MEGLKLIEGKVKKIFQNENNHVVVLATEDGDLKLSGFGQKPEELNEGKIYSFEYVSKKVDDKTYNNYKSFVEGNLKMPKFKEESVEDSPKSVKSGADYVLDDARQKLITVGQAANMAHAHLVSINQSHDLSALESWAKKYYELIRKMQKEALQ